VQVEKSDAAHLVATETLFNGMTVAVMQRIAGNAVVKSSCWAFHGEGALQAAIDCATRTSEAQVNKVKPIAQVFTSGASKKCAAARKALAKARASGSSAAIKLAKKRVAAACSQ
jgi:hypothetical protein